MLALFASLSILVVALLGWGGVAAGRALGKRPPADDEMRLALEGFTGFFAFSVAGTVLHVLTPLGPGWAAAFAAAGIALFIARWRERLAGVSRTDVLAGGALLAALAALSSAPVRLYDTGLYHLPSVRWLSEYPVVFGLANLHQRLGTNSSLFPAAALLELPGLGGLSPQLAAALVLFFFSTAVARAIQACFRGAPTPSRLLLALGAWPAILAAADDSVPSLSTDLPVTFLTIVSAALLLRSGNAERRFEERAALALAALAVSVKLSAAGWFLGCLLAARALPPASLLLFAAPWFVRGVALSGCLFFPSGLGRIGSLPWTIPSDRAAAAAAKVGSWARAGRVPEEMVSGVAWLPRWAVTTAVRPSVAPLLLLGVAGVVLYVLRRPGRDFLPSVRRTALASAVASVFWFATAPDPRFAYGALFVLAALPFVAARARPVGAATRAERRAAAVLLGLALAGASGVRVRRAAQDPVGSHPLLSPPRAIVPEAVTRRSAAGEPVFMPARPSVDDRCGAAPLPCTPELDPELVVERRADGRFLAFRSGR
ncbi:MAG: LIC_10190 family membrane protein [Thermoanaerobaculia bacterium]